MFQGLNALLLFFTIPTNQKCKHNIKTEFSSLLAYYICMNEKIEFEWESDTFVVYTFKCTTLTPPARQYENIYVEKKVDAISKYSFFVNCQFGMMIW